MKNGNWYLGALFLIFHCFFCLVFAFWRGCGWQNAVSRFLNLLIAPGCKARNMQMKFYLYIYIYMYRYLYIYTYIYMRVVCFPPKWSVNRYIYIYIHRYIYIYIDIWLESTYVSFSRQKAPFNLMPSFCKNWHRCFKSLPGWADVFQTSFSITGPRKHRRRWKWYLTPQKRVIWLQCRDGNFRPALGTHSIRRHFRHVCKFESLSLETTSENASGQWSCNKQILKLSLVHMFQYLLTTSVFALA